MLRELKRLLVFCEKVFADSFLKIYQLKYFTIYLLKIKRHKLAYVFCGDLDLKRWQSTKLSMKINAWD